jgi:hypothetical protein
MLEYPKMENVRTANRLKLAMWARFLPSPGSAWIGQCSVVFDVMHQAEATTLKAILARFNELGGWSPAVSKKLGWDEPVDNTPRDA